MRVLAPAVVAAVAAAAVLSASATPPAAPAIMYLNSSGLTPSESLAGLACAGLLNRDPATPAYVANPGDDLDWLQLVHGISDPPLTSHSAFLAACLQGPAKGRYIRYGTAQQKLIPNIVTLAGVLDAVPLEAADPLPAHATVLVFDAVTTFGGFTPLQATRYVFEHHVQQTTGMSKMNPGYEAQSGKAILRPNITKPAHIGLSDYVVKERLFNFYLTEGCLPLTEEHALMERIVKHNPWPKPIAVMGYDQTFAIGGDLFEAETTCVSGMVKTLEPCFLFRFCVHTFQETHRNSRAFQGMGQIASDGVDNLAYWSRTPTITQPLPHNQHPAVAYGKERTYIAFLIGDGDNVAYLKNSRRDWITNRLKACNGTACSYPLLWTMSPHVLHLAPDWAQWYAQQLLKTKTDRFALPPSGHLYACESALTALSISRPPPPPPTLCVHLNVDQVMTPPLSVLHGVRHRPITIPSRAAGATQQSTVPQHWTEKPRDTSAADKIALHRRPSCAQRRATARCSPPLSRRHGR